MKIWVTVSSFDRKKITEITIRQLVEYKQDSFIHVSDDYSSEYDLDWISSLGADEVERPPEKYGIDRIRAWELQKFLETDFDLIYFTDNDAYHDPIYIDVLKDAYKKFNKPVSLYNSMYHTKYNESLDDKFFLRESMPGISHLYDRNMAKKIIEKINIEFPDGIRMWDYMFVNFLDTKVVTCKTSYLQHYGAGGMHNGPGDYERDRALSPSQYLIDTRDLVLKNL
jgi:hypothetical protein